MTIQDSVSSVSGSPVFTMFEVEHCRQLDPVRITRLAAGVAAAIRVRSFFTVQECASIIDALDHVEMGSYDEHLVQPRIAKLGPTAYDYYGQAGLRGEYWLEAQRAADIRAGLLNGSDPLELALTKLQNGWTGSVLAATAGGRPIFAGLIREIHGGAKLHFDEIQREMPNAFDQIPIAQIAFNCHLSMPAEGGEAEIYRRRWRPNDERSRDGYGYARSVVDDEPSVRVRADVGDVVLFDPRNYHTVNPCRGEGRRITLSFFIGVSGSGDLIVWS